MRLKNLQLYLVKFDVIAQCISYGRFQKKGTTVKIGRSKDILIFFHYKKLESLNRWSQQSPLNSEFFYCINFMFQKCGQIFLYFEQPPLHGPFF